MDLNQSQDLDAVDHWNRAVDAQDAENYLTAIEEYDACLCSSPDAETAFEAFYFLGRNIQRAYDLDDIDLDEEQLAWLRCELACCERTCDIYVVHHELWPEETREAFELIYFESQALLGVGRTPNRSWLPASSHVKAAETLGLLGCFSENLSFQFDSNGEPLDNPYQDEVSDRNSSPPKETEPMITQIIMPKLSPTMEEGQISRWLKKEGDYILPGEPIAEIDTDKATMEMQGLTAGFLRKILVGEGESAPLGQVIAIIGDANDDMSGLTHSSGVEHLGEDESSPASPMHDGLLAEMLSLVCRLNNVIKEYEGTTGGLLTRLNTTTASAKGELTRGQGYRDTALKHLQQQSVNPNQVYQPALSDFADSVHALAVSRKHLTEAETYLQKLQKQKKPEGHTGVFAGLGILGFVISICAAANAARGEGFTTFIIVNILFLGVATGIAIARIVTASSAMKADYDALNTAILEVESSLDAAIKHANSEYTSQIMAFQAVFIPKVENLKKRFSDFYLETGFVGRNWTDGSWNQWSPVTSPAFSACLGTLKSPKIEMVKPYFPDSLLDFSIPALVPFADGTDGKCLLQKATGRIKEDCVRAAQSLMLRLLANVPPGKVLFTLLDPVGLGQSAAAFMSLADHEEKLITNRAWTEPHHIEEQLGKLTEHMENVIQKYLRNDYSTIEEYNQKAGEVAEPYRVLVVFDFPVNFTETAARRLASIAKNGPRCGVYTLIVMDTDPSKKLPYGFNLADLENAANVITHDGNRFVWARKNFERYTVLLDSPPSEQLFKHIVKENGSRAPELMRVEVPFDKLLTKAGVDHDSIWTGSTRERIHVPLGPQGAKKLQYLTLGTGTEHHAVCIGNAGFG